MHVYLDIYNLLDIPKDSWSRFLPTRTFPLDHPLRKEYHEYFRSLVPSASHHFGWTLTSRWSSLWDMVKVWMYYKLVPEYPLNVFFFFSENIWQLKIATQWLLVEETLESWVSVPPCNASKWFIQSEQSSAGMNRVVLFFLLLFYMILCILPQTIRFLLSYFCLWAHMTYGSFAKWSKKASLVPSWFSCFQSIERP